MSSLWLPDPLYRSLPALYLISGLTALITFRGNAFAAASALLLMAAAVTVGIWRYRHRTVASTSQTARQAFFDRRRRASNEKLFQG